MAGKADKAKTAVIGVGHFGLYHAEKLAKIPGSKLVAVADTDSAPGIGRRGPAGRRSRHRPRRFDRKGGCCQRRGAHPQPF